MGIERSVEKLDKYNKRLTEGKVQKIKPGHVEKVIRKLRAKEKSLLAELEGKTKEVKIERLNRKLSAAREQIGRAEWLLQKISDV